jgi:hypothetical protein
MLNLIHKPFAFLLATLAMVHAAWAGNPWASAIGEACAVEHRAEAIAKRIQRTAPQSHLVRHAMALDQLACTLVQSLKCGAPCNQVQGLYRQLEGTWAQLRVAIYTDPCLCSDRTLKSLADGMDTRIRNLCRAIERVIEREYRYAPRIGYPVGSSNRIPLAVPSYSYRVSPYQSPGFPSPGFPSLNYSARVLPSPNFFAPNFFAPGFPAPGWNQPRWPGQSMGGSGHWRAF